MHEGRGGMLTVPTTVLTAMAMLAFAANAPGDRRHDASIAAHRCFFEVTFGRDAGMSCVGVPQKLPGCSLLGGGRALDRLSFRPQVSNCAIV